MIRYTNDVGEPSQVIVKMKESFEADGSGSGCEPLEFDVDFAGLPLQNMDATINWRATSLDNKGIFYTDSNGLGMIRRQEKKVVDVIDSVKSNAPANYYPINSAIFMEDTDIDDQLKMLVMNDRPMGGSGFRKGRIELMFNRRGSS